MGKPFKQELELVYNTYLYSYSLKIDEAKEFIEEHQYPIYFVGSGGSLSACHYASSLVQANGRFAKAITPLELISLKNSVKSSIVIFISAGGNNKDIILGFKEAVKQEPKGIGCFCMKKNSLLSELSKKYTLSRIFEFDLPSGNDGFLATNSLVAFYTILYRIFSENNNETLIGDYKEETNEIIDSFLKRISPNHTIHILYAGWGHSVAIDLESKCTESALINTLIADFRNFGHGRHHWFAKKENNSSIVALVTPTYAKLAKKTLELLPTTVPKLILNSTNNSSLASIELLFRSFHFINKLGETLGIDPGRPGVPPFGRKLYHLNYISTIILDESDDIDPKIKNAILRKTKSSFWGELKNTEMQFWKSSYWTFIEKTSKAKFGCIVMDYDGTICDSENRYTGPSKQIAEELVRILDSGFLVGIVTGRGKSVKFDLRKIIPAQLWSNIIIGYYNGSEVGFLNNDLLPDQNLEINISLSQMYDIIKPIESIYKLNPELRPNQLSIKFEEKKDWDKAKSLIRQIINSSGIKDIQILESSHSIDVIPASVSKVDIIDFCKSSAENLGIETECLCIGDKGEWPGNDYKLLDTPFALSVDEISSNPLNCWNLASVCIRNSDATLEYLKQIRLYKNYFRIKLN